VERVRNGYGNGLGLGVRDPAHDRDRGAGGAGYIGPGGSGRQDQGGNTGQSHPPQGTRTYGTGNERARQVLAERYARGEIETSEYQERLRALREE